MGIGICFGLIGVSGRFVPLYLGPGYDRVVTMLVLMSPIVVIIGVSNCLGSQYYTPSGNRKLSAKFIIIGAVVNLTLNLILIPRFWGYGAIVASLIAEPVITVLYFRHCNGYLTADTLFKSVSNISKVSDVSRIEILFDMKCYIHNRHLCFII